jgi:hypothetical protein
MDSDHRYFVHVSRWVPALYQQIGMVGVDAPDPQSALEQVQSGLESGKLSPQWVPPEEDTIGVQIAPGEPGPILIDSDAIPLDEPPRQ